MKNKKRLLLVSGILLCSGAFFLALRQGTVTPLSLGFPGLSLLGAAGWKTRARRKDWDLKIKVLDWYMRGKSDSYVKGKVVSRLL